MAREVLIEGILPGGVGFYMAEGEKVHVSRTVPGDRVRVGKVRRDRGRLWATLIEVIDRGLSRRQARCVHFGQCGGCDWMDIPYEDQCALKAEMVGRAFERVELTPEIHPILPSPEEFRYRNRLDYAFANSDAGPVLGLYERGDARNRTHALPPVCAVEDCWLATEGSNRVRDTVQSAMSGSRLRAYNPVSRSGVLRWLEIRTEGEERAIVQLNVSNDKHVDTARVAEVLKEQGEAKGFGVRVSRARSRHAPPKGERTVFGDTRQTIDILGTSIAFSGSSFSQVNRFQLQALYRVAVDLAEPRAEDEVLDLYCGVGALSLPLAGRVARLVGIEQEERGVADARANATNHGISNCDFKVADASDLSAWGKPVRRFSLVTVNPPRAGLSPAVVEGLASTHAERIVYVSCNPETVARDCRLLTSHNYRITDVCPVDMFPQTTHVETVVRLRRLV